MEISPCSGPLLSVLYVISHLTNEPRIVIITIFQIRKQTQSLSNFPCSESQGWLMVMPRFEPMPSAPESALWINILLTLRATNKTISSISKESVDFSRIDCFSPEGDGESRKKYPWNYWKVCTVHVEGTSVETSWALYTGGLLSITFF